MRSKGFIGVVALIVVLVIAVGTFIVLKTRLGMNLLQLPQKTQTDKQTKNLPSKVAEPTTTPTISAYPSGDLPPLYPKATWREPRSEIFVFLTRPGDFIEVEGLTYLSDPVTSYPSEFLQYYQQELKKRGWVITSDVEGEDAWSYWKKGDHYVVFGFDGDINGENFVLLVQHNM